MEQEFARVRNFSQTKVGLVVAVAAVVDALFVVEHGDEAAGDADVDFELVGIVVHSTLRERGRSVGEHAVPFHLPETKPTVSCPALRGLAGEADDGTLRPAVDFVDDHVLQPLVVGGAGEDERVDLLPPFGRCT